MRKCSYCGMENSDEAEICASCYTILPEPVQPQKRGKQGKSPFTFGKKEKPASASKTCPLCGTVNSPDAVYCSGCFSDLGGGKSSGGVCCPNCGAQNTKGDEFCVACGAALSSGGSGGTKTCPVCMAANDASADTCAVCGSPLSQETGEACPVCGTENPAGAKTCISCGTRLSGGKSGFAVKKLAWVAAGVAVVAGAVMGVSAILNNVQSPISESMEMLGAALSQRVSQMSTIHDYVENSQAVNDTGAFAIEIDLETENADLAGTVFYDRNAKLLSGSVEWDDDAKGIDTILTFSADDEVVEFEIPQSPDIYGCDLDDFAESKLAGLLPINISGETLKNLYKKPDTSDLTGDGVESAWNKFLKTVEYEEISESKNYPGCRVYQVSWDEKAMKELLGQATEEAQSGFSIIEGASNAAANLFGQAGKSTVQFFASYMEQDCRLYINESGQVVAADFTIKSILGFGGDVCTIEIADPADPWSYWSLTSLKGTASGYLMSDEEGAELAVDINAMDLMDMNLTAAYDDSSGAFGVDLLLGELDMGLTGKVISRNGSAKIELNGSVIGLGQVELTMGVDNLEASEVPAMISANGKFVDITDAKNWDRMYQYLTS